MAGPRDQSSGSTKICIVCGLDCSKKPRTKDARGRYTCKTCAEGLALGETPAAPVAAIREAAPAAPQIADDDAIPLAPLDDEPAVSPPATPKSRPPTTRAPSIAAESTREERAAAKSPQSPQGPANAPAKQKGPCPACGSTMPEGSVVCVNCGFDRRKGFQKGTGIGATKRKGGELLCPECGYDMKGLATNTCPECGEKVSPERMRIARREREQKSMYVWLYLTPILLTLGGTGLAVWQSDAMGMPIEAYFLVFAVEVVLAMMIYVGCGVTWIGFAVPIPVAALQLIGCLSFMEGARWTARNMLKGLPSVIYLNIAIYGFIMILTAGLMAKVMDMDMEDAAMVCTLISLVAFFVLPVMAVMGWI